jgi:hypothetical protein
MLKMPVKFSPIRINFISGTKPILSGAKLCNITDTKQQVNHHLHIKPQDMADFFLCDV